MNIFHVRFSEFLVMCLDAQYAKYFCTLHYYEGMYPFSEKLAFILVLHWFILIKNCIFSEFLTIVYFC